MNTFYGILFKKQFTSWQSTSFVLETGSKYRYDRDKKKKENRICSRCLFIMYLTASRVSARKIENSESTSDPDFE